MYIVNSINIKRERERGTTERDTNPKIQSAHVHYVVSSQGYNREDAYIAAQGTALYILYICMCTYIILCVQYCTLDIVCLYYNVYSLCVYIYCVVIDNFVIISFSVIVCVCPLFIRREKHLILSLSPSLSSLLLCPFIFLSFPLLPFL